MPRCGTADACERGAGDRIRIERVRIDAGFVQNAEFHLPRTIPIAFMPSLTEVARRIADSSWAAVDESIGDEAVRALVNWLGCAIEGCREAHVDPPLRSDEPTEELAIVSMLGSGEQIDLPAAATIMATAADVLTYTDTHVPTQLRPGAVVGAALLPLAEHRAAAGAEFVHAYILGSEFACRIALALGVSAGPNTGEAVLCNALGAAAGCSKLLGLDVQRTARALDAACAAIEAEDARRSGRWPNDAAGLAANTGLRAALDASRRKSVDSSSQWSSPLDSLTARCEAFLAGWGSRWENDRLAYHAYPCALVLHPVVEACLQLKRAYHLTSVDVASVQVRVHPTQAALSESAESASAIAAKHSVQHAATVALLDGQAGLAQFRGEKLRNEKVNALRARIALAADPALPDTAARVTIMQPNGTMLERLVRCALGHPSRPLEDRELSDKFRALAGETLSTGQTERLLGLIWNVRALPDMGGLVRTTIPEDVYEPAELPGSPLLPR